HTRTQQQYRCNQKRPLHSCLLTNEREGKHSVVFGFYACGYRKESARNRNNRDKFELDHYQIIYRKSERSFWSPVIAASRGDVREGAYCTIALAAAVLLAGTEHAL